MKKIETLAIVIIVLLLVSTLLPWVSNLILPRLYGPKVFGEISFATHGIAMLMHIFRQLLNIGIGVWLFTLAGKEPDATPWTWLLLGIFFGLIAPILFYVIKAYETVKPTER
jgi:hypothetical protein